MLKLDNSIIYTPCKKVASDEEHLPKLYSIFVELSTLMRQHNGCGIAAIQVGLPARMFVVRSSEQDKDDEFYLNCGYRAQISTIFNSEEGCLSFPGRKFLVPRYRNIIIHGKSLVKKNDELLIIKIKEKLIRHPLSVVFQHEMDHCVGVTIDKKGREIKCLDSLQPT